MPGPALAVCEGDTVIVDVKNHLQTETTSVHFHGKKELSDLSHINFTKSLMKCQYVGEVSLFVYRKNKVGSTHSFSIQLIKMFDYITKVPKYSRQGHVRSTLHFFWKMT